MKVDFIKLNSANVSANNSEDEARVYDITANINVVGGKVSNIDSGVVTKDGVEVASFSKWGENNSNKSFYGVSDEEQNVLLNEINAFCRYVNEKLEVEPITI